VELKGILLLVMGGEKWIIKKKIQGLLLVQGLISTNAVQPIVCALCSLQSGSCEWGFRAGALYPAGKAGAVGVATTGQPWSNHSN